MFNSSRFAATFISHVNKTTFTPKNWLLDQFHYASQGLTTCHIFITEIFWIVIICDVSYTSRKNARFSREVFWFTWLLLNEIYETFYFSGLMEDMIVQWGLEEKKILRSVFHFMFPPIIALYYCFRWQMWDFFQLPIITISIIYWGTGEITIGKDLKHIGLNVI